MWWLNDSAPESSNRQQSPSQEKIDQVSESAPRPLRRHRLVGLAGVTRLVAQQGRVLGSRGSRCHQARPREADHGIPFRVGHPGSNMRVFFRLSPLLYTRLFVR